MPHSAQNRAPGSTGSPHTGTCLLRPERRSGYRTSARRRQPPHDRTSAQRCSCVGPRSRRATSCPQPSVHAATPGRQPRASRADRSKIDRASASRAPPPPRAQRRDRTRRARAGPERGRTGPRSRAARRVAAASRSSASRQFSPRRWASRPPSRAAPPRSSGERIAGGSSATNSISRSTVASSSERERRQPGLDVRLAPVLVGDLAASRRDRQRRLERLTLPGRVRVQRDRPGDGRTGGHIRRWCCPASRRRAPTSGAAAASVSAAGLDARQRWAASPARISSVTLVRAPVVELQRRVPPAQRHAGGGDHQAQELLPAPVATRAWPVRARARRVASASAKWSAWSGTSARLL